MQLTVTVSDDEDLILPLSDVPPNQTLGTLKSMLEPILNIAPDKQQIFFDNRHLTDASLTLEGAGIKDGDMIIVMKTQARAPSRQPRQMQPEDEGLEAMRQKLLETPAGLENVRKEFPELADAVNDPIRFAEIYHERQRQQQAENDDPYNIEGQKRIEEMIRRQRVEENLEQAWETAPELFGRVTMLYIPVEVNGVPIKAFVDSGAQTTVMSAECAEKCNIMRLVDQRQGGIAKGVGTAKILGRVHMAPIQIASHFLDCSFSVIEGKDIDLLLGLDMLKRYQACIDLQKNALRIGVEEVQFLPESEIPKQDFDAPKPMIQGPDGELIDPATGAVIPEDQVKGKKPEPVVNSTSTQGENQGPSQVAQSDGAAEASTSAAASSSAAQGTAGKVQQLVAMGFPKQLAEHALQQAGGDVELAAGLLFDS